MLERISPVLLVSVAVGGFVVMSSLPATAESAGERLDRLHEERPVAAAGNQSSAGREIVADIARRISDAMAAAETPPVVEPPVVQEEPTAQQVSWQPAGRRYGSCGGDVECFLACTRAHESDTAGGYGAVSSGGAYRGAYQFQQNTWDAAVAGAGHGEYAGVPADQVPPEVQDAAAAHLYSVSGNNPWGGRC
jgi:hypothetical protein